MRDSIGRSGGHARRIRLFTVRTLREILRDPLSFVICLGVPLVLLVAMYALFSPTEPWFTLDMLTPGIAVFSGAFAMLYMALLVSRDRATWFLTRLYSSPLTDGGVLCVYRYPVRLTVLGQGGAGVVLGGHIRRGLSQWRVDAGRIPVGGLPHLLRMAPVLSSRPCRACGVGGQCPDRRLLAGRGGRVRLYRRVRDRRRAGVPV